MPHIESGLQAWYYSYSSIHTHPSYCGSWLFLLGVVGTWVAPASLHSSGCISSFGSTRGQSAGILPYQWMPVLLHLEKSSTFWGLGGECFNHLWAYPVSYLFPPPALVSLVLSTFLTERVTGQFILLIFVVPGCKEASWLLTVLNMLADIPCQCPIIKDLIMDFMLSHMIKDLILLHLTLWMLKGVCCADRGSLLQSFRH